MCSFADPVKLRLLQDQKKKILPRRTNLKNLKSPGVNIEIPFSGSQFESQHLPLAPARSNPFESNVSIMFYFNLLRKLDKIVTWLDAANQFGSQFRVTFEENIFVGPGQIENFSVIYSTLKFKLSGWLKMKQPIIILRECFKECLLKFYLIGSGRFFFAAYDIFQ